ncbi:b9 domain-containing protein 2-like protein [Fimicolochytrium jonesii]|uniref:b9 domain-containing protein 2-like protein n=1 Tax=Fimicolochytrium jonesii TaxID=1396493 RepID=UPI0022FE486B|nr:b9 domain-containing protein 2-like protein [Fimicolochytrium jonesii]KAI8817954.1 b9 domain-containing protein 2-like protein [Fimicolochytrium jonesii]
MAEVHIIGTLAGASGFPSSQLRCKWRIVAGDGWRLIEGDVEGSTQVDMPQASKFTAWSHPLDLHYATKTVTGWPKIQVQVLRRDWLGRDELYGYGFTHIPTTPGEHKLEIVTWRPALSTFDSLYSWIFGTTPTLVNTDLVHTPTDRFRLTTCSMGKVHLNVGIILRNFEGYGVAM